MKNGSRPRRFDIERLEERQLLSAGPVGPEFRVNSHTTSAQWFPSVAVDGTGNFVFAWESSNQDGSGSGVYAQRYNAFGVQQGPEFRVNTTTSDNQFRAAVAADPAGNFVVAWTSVAQDGSNEGVYAQRYDSSGIAVGSEFRVNTFTAGAQLVPSVAMDNAGNFAITWTSYGQDGSGGGVYAQRYAATGTPLGAEFRVNTNTLGSQLGASIAMDASGDFVVVWSVTAGQVYAQRYNSSGVLQGGEFQVNSYTGGTVVVNSVDMDDAGNFVASWESDNQDGSGFGIYARRYNASGTPLGSEFLVNSHTTGNQRFSRVSMDAGGDFVVTWSSYAQDGSAYGIYAQRYTSAGFPDGAEFQVNSYTTSAQLFSASAMDPSGDFIIGWTSFGQGDSFDVYAQRFSSAPINLPPTANAGGPYSVAEGQSLALAGSGSDPEGGALSYSWDLNGDGAYGDAVGAAPIVTWAELVALGIQDGPGSWVVRLRVTDPLGASTDSSPTSLSVTNAPPTCAVVTVPGSAVRGEPFEFTFFANDPGVTDQASDFTYAVDWDGNGTFDQLFSGPSGQVVVHVFTASGTYNVRATAADRDGAVSSVTTRTVTVANWTLRQDPFDSSKTNLLWGGTNGFDAYYFIFPGLVLIQAQNNAYFSTPQPVFTGAFNGKVYVYAQGAGDLIFADVMSASMVIDGGDGDDVLIGGRGADRITGGNGNDILFGGTLEFDAADELFGDAGDDLLVGHFGADALWGGTGQDLIIAGRLSFADLPGAVFGIQAEWLSGRPIAERVANLTGTGSGPRNNGDTFLVPSVTVLDDAPLPPAVVDLIIGDADDDWLLYDFTEDLNLDVEPGDVATNLG